MYYTKLRISGVIETVTGMHIGGSTAFSPIGAVDSPIIRDIRSNLPMIPGSSLKGKIRTLAAKAYNLEAGITAENADGDCQRIVRVFGSAKKNQVHKSRAQFTDAVLQNSDELRKQGIDSMTEVKFENSINRLTAVANPRQIERSIRGSQFPLEILYEVEKEAEIIEDIEVLTNGMKYLQYDYLGGHGSRGYGKIKFCNLKIEIVFGKVEDSVLKSCQQMLEVL